MSLAITINGVDVTNKVNADSVRILSEKNSTRDTCEFSVDKLPTETFTPTLNAEVIVTLNGVRIFGGIVLVVGTRIVEPPVVSYTLDCVDFTHTLDRELVTERFTNETVPDILAFLFDKYAPDFTYTNITVTRNIERISFNRLTLSQCLNKLAVANNWQWYIDYNKNLHFFGFNDEPAPFNLTDTSNNYIQSSLVLRRDLSQLRNKILVEGGKVPTNERTKLYAGNGETTEFGTDYEYATLPTVTVDGVAQTVGVEFLDSTGFDCYWSFQQKYVRFEVAPPEPTSPDVTNVALIGNPLIPIVAKVPLPISISQFGIYEFAINDPTIANQEVAVERALAELEARARANREATFNTYTAGLRSGQVITINSALRGVNENYIIERVEFTPYPNGSGKAGIWRVELQSYSTMTLIQLMQKLLLNEKVEDDELETLLTYLTFSDSAVADDNLTVPSVLTEPYNYDEADWNFAKWA